MYRVATGFRGAPRDSLLSDGRESSSGPFGGWMENLCFLMPPSTPGTSSDGKRPAEEAGDRLRQLRPIELAIGYRTPTDR